MKVWSCGEFRNIELGQKVLVAHCGSGRTYFGEFGTLTKVLKKNLVFTTESGTIVKTSIDNLHQVSGKAKKENLFVSLNVEGKEDDKNFIRQRISY